MKFGTAAFSALLFLAAMSSATYAQHKRVTIHFSNFQYSPSSLTNIAIGDTVEWQGDGGSTFNEHPLSSTDIPSGASSFHKQDGSSTFEYVPSVAGTYNYKCDFHASFGMVGSFVVGGTDRVAPTKTVGVSLEQNTPNPFHHSTSITFELEKSAQVTLGVYDESGKEVARAIDNRMLTGKQHVQLGRQDLQSGVYFYRLTVDGVSSTKQMIVE